MSAATRKRLAVKAFRHVSEYDALIADYLGSDGSKDSSEDLFPEAIDLKLKKVQVLRYGENPHQQGALYSDDLPVAGTTLVGSLNQLHGPELSYNNLMDADAALAIVRDYTTPTVAIIKHAGPCGIASGDEDGDLAELFSRALAADPVSAFGGIVGINRPVDGTVAATIAKTRFDVLIAPAFSDEAIESWRANATCGCWLFPTQPYRGAMPPSQVSSRSGRSAAASWYKAEMQWTTTC